MLAAANAALPPPTPEQEQKTQEELLIEEYRQQIIKLAINDFYIIPVLGCVSGGQKVPDPFDRRKTIIMYGDWEYRKYRRYKIIKSDFDKAREMSIDYEGEGETEGRGLDKLMELYQFLAMCYFRMTPDEFMRADWGTIRPALDACQFRTSHSPADLSQGLYEFFHIESHTGQPLTAHLTNLDYELIKMYRLWVGKARTPPWKYNGGIIYEEDLNTVLKMEELQASGEAYKAKKEKAREGGGSVGEDGVVHRRSVRYKNR